MRKKNLRLLSLLLLLLIALNGCCTLYEGGTLESDGLFFHPHVIRKICFASNYRWNTSQTEATLTVPDFVDGYKVTQLGGYYGSGAPAPFLVNVPGIQMVYGKDTLPPNANIVPYHLTICLGKELKEVYFTAFDDFYDMDNNRFIQILVTIECDAENPYFYSENGKLYNRKDNTLVSGFFYYSDYVNS